MQVFVLCFRLFLSELEKQSFIFNTGCLVVQTTFSNICFRLMISQELPVNDHIFIYYKSICRLQLAKTWLLFSVISEVNSQEKCITVNQRNSEVQRNARNVKQDER